MFVFFSCCLCAFFFHQQKFLTTKILFYPRVENRLRVPSICVPLYHLKWQCVPPSGRKKSKIFVQLLPVNDLLRKVFDFNVPFFFIRLHLLGIFQYTFLYFHTFSSSSSFFIALIVPSQFTTNFQSSVKREENK